MNRHTPARCRVDAPAPRGRGLHSPGSLLADPTIPTGLVVESPPGRPARGTHATARSQSFSQGTAELFHDHAWVRNRAWIPRMAWQRLTDSEVAVAGREHRALELGTVAALGAKEEPRADNTAPDAVLLLGYRRRAAPHTGIVAARRMADTCREARNRHGGAAAGGPLRSDTSPFGGRKPYRGRVESRHSQVVGEGAV